MSPHWIREPFNSTAAFIYSPFPCAQCTGSRAAGSCSGSPRSGWAVPVGSSHFQRSGLPKEMIACSLYHLPGLSWRAPYPSGHSTKWKLVWCFHQARREEGKLESHPPHPSPFSPSLCPVLQHFLNKSCTTSPMEIIPLREDGIHSFRVSNVSGSSSFSPQPALESLERSLGKWPMSEVISPSPQPWVWEVINSLEIWFSSAQPKRQKKIPCWSTAREEICWDEEVTCASFAGAAQRKSNSKWCCEFLPALLSVIYLLLVPRASINGHQHGTDPPGHERHRQGEKERNEKLCLHCQRGFLCPPLQVWALKGLLGGVLPGMFLAGGSVNMRRDNFPFSTWTNWFSSEC